ncbi:IPT/TIG domain-containing protein [Granulicella cerasi]|uniref:IPT/TIG domain-containing protein n=1 Tax=Granulicella cerasi TaxID=741063 RepID=A0ABW1Z998_9BACT|nr:IPT/TIG domain-containing protein [Granulicella cerasi]
MRNKYLAALLLMLVSLQARAGNPRFVTGTNYATPGVPMAFGVTNIAYFTDPGNLNSVITHAQADAVIAAAAATWNVPVASLTLAQGGVLNEDVSSANTYFDGTSVVFPADLQPTNFAAKPIAVVYDADGSLINLLLGAGASVASSCRQNGVVESVDGFSAAGNITHAMMLINGNCFNASTDSLKQMQYMAMRAFGRVLGLGWSQANDNVFTGSPAPTATQMAHWPVMHPIDVLCGTYTYLCMQNPFTLRADDLSTLSMLYPVASTNALLGKLASMNDAVQITGSLYGHDSGGTGAEAVNLAMQPIVGAAIADYVSVSSITGFRFQQNQGNPVTGAPSPALLAGASDAGMQGFFTLYRIPGLASMSGNNLRTEAVNPLYTGSYALGDMQRPPATPGNALINNWSITSAPYQQYGLQLFDSLPTCYSSTNGAENAPPLLDATGWWSDVLCGANYPAWKLTPTIRGGHSWTYESLALDQTGAVSAAKAQIVLGAWRSSDATGTLPTVATAPVPQNGAIAGLTQMKVSATASDGVYRLTLADYYGDGRPDYLYKARLMYADAVTPASVSASGGQITITGTGFSSGNRVTVNGVVAKVTSWSANTIVATAPSLSAAKATAAIPVEVAVADLTTGATTAIAGALVYAGVGSFGLLKISAPASLETGITASTPFALRVVAADGVTAIAGANVRLAVTAGGASLVACGAASACSLTSDSTGVVQSAVAGTAAGAVTLTATELSGGASVQVTLTDLDPVRAVVLTPQSAWIAAGASVTLPIALNAVQDSVAATGVSVQWSATAGLLLSASASITSNSGAANLSVGTNGLAAGTAQVVGCAWTSTCAVWTLTAVDASQWTPVIVSGAGQNMATSAAFAPVTLSVVDRSGHPLAGAPIAIAQTVTAWAGPCPSQGRCAAAPILASTQTSAVTDSNGQSVLIPLAIANTAATTNIAVSSGTNGFVSLSLVKSP